MNRSSKVPLYKQLKQKIKKDIQDSFYQIGQIIPTEQDFCEEFAISRQTVREAITELVNEGLVERVQGKGTIVKARGPVARNRHMTGIIVPGLDLFISKIVVGVEKVLSKYNYKLLFANTDSDLELQKKYIKELKDEEVSGMIVFPAEDKDVDEQIKELEAEGFPLVVIDRILENVDANYVTVNNTGGGYKAVDYLINLNHRHIGFVSHCFWKTSSVKDRFAGYKKALKEYQLPLEEKNILSYNPYDINKKATIDMISRYLTNDDRPTALFAVNDLIAIDLINICRRLAIRIPDDLSIIGFDNSELLTRLNIPLTTIAQPKEEIGVKAAQLLIEQVENNSPRERLVLPTKLIIRKSCDILNKKQPNKCKDPYFS